MVEFNRSIKRALPFNRRQYLKWMGDDLSVSTDWYGVSFQLPGGFEGREIGLTEFFENYEAWFTNLIAKLDNGSRWIVNHDTDDRNWFPNDEDNLTDLRTLFKENDIPNTFRGALIFTLDDLSKFSRDLISYSVAVINKDGWYYSDLDISHGDLPLIIKLTAHSNIHLLSTDKEFLREVVNDNNGSVFIVREYRGTSLL